jgi:hypothetical protein
MSNGNSDLLVFLGAAFAALVGLTAVHTWYGSYIDVQYAAKLQEGGVSEALTAALAKAEANAQPRKLPIDKAISVLEQRGRKGVSSIAPTPSQDLSAVAGWIQAPGFKPVTAHPVRTAAAK